MCQRPQVFFAMGCLLVGVVALGVLPSGANGQDGLDLERRFLTEAPQRWEDYLRFARRLQVSIPRKSHSRTEYKQADGAALYISDHEVEGSNPSYSFRLERPSSERSWRLADLQMANVTVKPHDVRMKVQERVLRDICSCLTVWNLWLPSLIQDPDFKIKSVHPHPQKQGEWIRVEFEYRKRWDDYPIQGGWRITRGWMALDPTHDWILREFAVNYKSTPGDREEALAYKRFDIKEGTDRHPIITRTEFRITGKEKVTLHGPERAYVLPHGSL